MTGKKNHNVLNVPDFFKNNIPSRKLEDIKPKLFIGDTPEQLNTKSSNWVDVLVINGKAYTAQDVKNLLNERDTLKVNNKALANAIVNALYGTLLDEHGNRDENGLLAWGKAEDARNALIGVSKLARKQVRDET